jgi:transcriptional regulator with XRE-family HTH domain
MRKTATTKRELDGRKQSAAFGQAIYQLRIKAELSQEELAFRSNIGRNYISVLERGEKEPCLGIIFRLSKALNASMVDIFGLAEQLYKEGYKPASRRVRVR